MSKRKTVKWWKDELGFNTKKEVEDYIRNIVNTSELCKPIEEKISENLLKILKHHHNFIKKIGIGLKHLEIRINPSWNGPTKGLWIVRTDNSEVDISWVTALKPDGRPSVKEDISNAARYEISDQIHSYHDRGECNLCDICGKIMIRGNKLHVDHIIPFEKIFLDFLESSKITYSNISVKDIGVETEFNDRDFAHNWKEFHKNNATLRIVHKECNLRRQRK